MSAQHNELQQLCTDIDALDANAEFAIEPLYGIRQWFIYNIQERPCVTGFYNDTDWLLPQRLHTARCELQQRVQTREVVRLNYSADNVLSGAAAGELAAELSRGLQLPDTVIGTLSSTLSVIAGSTPSKRADYDPETYFGHARSSYSTRFKLYGSADQAFDTLELAITSALRNLVGRSLRADDDWRYGFHVYLDAHEVWPHPPATPSCTCGFYAYHTREGLRDNMHQPGFYSPVTFGLIKASGHVTVGSKGLRVEKAEILALTPAMIAKSTDPLSIWQLSDSYDAELLSQYSREYNVPVVSSLAALLNLATEYGIMLDHHNDGPELRSQLPPLPLL